MFRRRDLSGVDQVYLRADGIHVTIRLEEHKPCEVVMVGEGRPTLHQDTDLTRTKAFACWRRPSFSWPYARHAQARSGALARP
jgi:hypothetical protein